MLLSSSCRQFFINALGIFSSCWSVLQCTREFFGISSQLHVVFSSENSIMAIFTLLGDKLDDLYSYGTRSRGICVLSSNNPGQKGLLVFFYLDIERNQQFTVQIAFQKSCPLPLNILEVLQHCGKFVRTK